MTVGRSDPAHVRLAQHLADVPIRELLPPLRAGAVPASADLDDHLVLPGGAVLSVLRSGPEVLVVPLTPTWDGVRRSVAGDGAFEGLFETMRLGGRADRFTAWTMGPSRGKRLHGERAIDVDQSNESVVVAEQAIVKLYPRTSAGPQPGLDLPVHLAAGGFTAIPAPMGAITWTQNDGADVLLATAAAFLAGARDGWDWYLERVLARLDGDVDDERAFGPAASLGSLAAQMHAALASASETIPEPVRISDAGTAAAWRDAGLATMEDAIVATDGEEGERLRARAQEVRAAVISLERASGILLTRIHGDFHVGQILRWDGGYAVTDFDGDPVAPVETRAAFDAPVRDVAAFVRSLDHLGRIAQARRPGRDADAEAWIARTREAFLDAYRQELATFGRAALFEEGLLHPFEVIQELHEYVYAARFLPRWRYVPDLAMRALFPRPGE